MDLVQDGGRPLRKPALRIDGGKRINLNKLRHREKRVTPVEDTRVVDMWAREDIRQCTAKRAAKTNATIAKLRDGAGDGSIVTDVAVRLSYARKEKRLIRAMPGTFDWRYGRKTADASLYHAGCHFATLWEQAGATGAKSVDWGATPGGDWKGLPDSRAAAMARIRDMTRGESGLGTDQVTRLIAYCIKGWTTAQIAAVNQTKEREMAPVLHHDLRALAKHFHFIDRRG